jgi:hypothetical protein
MGYSCRRSPEEYLPRLGVLLWSPHYPAPMRISRNPALSCSGGVLVLVTAIFRDLPATRLAATGCPKNASRVSVDGLNPAADASCGCGVRTRGLAS